MMSDTDQVPPTIASNDPSEDDVIDLVAEDAPKGEALLDNETATTAAAGDDDRSEEVDELIQLGLQQIQSAATELAQAEDGTVTTEKPYRITVAQYDVGFVAAIVLPNQFDPAGFSAASTTAFRADTIFVVIHHEAAVNEPDSEERVVSDHLTDELSCVVVDRELGSVELAVRYGLKDGVLDFGEGEVRPSEFSEPAMAIAQAVTQAMETPYEELPDWIVMPEYFQGVASTFRSYIKDAGGKVILDNELE